MGNYVAGPSVLRLTGRVGAVIPGEAFAHDFSRTGPEGGDGPAREAALLASGAIRLPSGERSELAKLDAATVAALEATAAAAPTEPAVTSADAAAPTIDDSTDSAARSSRRRTAATDAKEN